MGDLGGKKRLIAKTLYKPAAYNQENRVVSKKAFLIMYISTLKFHTLF